MNSEWKGKSEARAKREQEKREADRSQCIDLTHEDGLTPTIDEHGEGCECMREEGMNQSSLHWLRTCVRMFQSRIINRWRAREPIVC